MPTTLHSEIVEFTPSRVEGVSGVRAVRFHPDRFELLTDEGWRPFPYLSFAIGRDVRTGHPIIGKLSFSNAYYPDSHFTFFTTPTIAIFMPTDGPTTYPHSHFWRVQEMLRNAGIKICDEYENPFRRPLLKAHPRRTLLWSLLLLIACWLYALSGFLPGAAGAVARGHLLTTPVKPNLMMAFMFPIFAVPFIAFRHANSRGALTLIVLGASLATLASEWALRTIVHDWAPLERPPFNKPFWSAHNLSTHFLAVVVGALVGASWRRSGLLPISETERNRAPALPPAVRSKC